MLAINLGLSLLAANIAIHTQEARGASADAVGAMARQFAISTALRTGKTTSATRPGIVESCQDVNHCVSSIRVETGANHVVLMRVIGLPSRIRLSATLVLSALDQDVPKSAMAKQTAEGNTQHTIDIAHDPKTWPDEFAKLADKLFALWKKPTGPPRLPTGQFVGSNGNATTISIVSGNTKKEAEWLWKWSWIGSGALLAAGGMVADTLMPSSHNQRLDNEDFIGPGLILAGILAGISGIYLNPNEEDPDEGQPPDQ